MTEFTYILKRFFNIDMAVVLGAKYRLADNGRVYRYFGKG